MLATLTDLGEEGIEGRMEEEFGGQVHPFIPVFIIFLFDKLNPLVAVYLYSRQQATHAHTLLTRAGSTPGPTHARLALWAEKTDEAQLMGYLG